MGSTQDYQQYLRESWAYPNLFQQKKPHSILIVEDSEMDYYVLESVLKARSVSVVHVECIEEAKLILQGDRKFDLIICDQFLPGNGTGVELWRFCQEKYPNIPFMMTSVSNLEEFFNAAEKGMVPNMLDKPFTPKQAWTKIAPYLYNAEKGVGPTIKNPSHARRTKIIGAISLAFIIAVSFLF